MSTDQDIIRNTTGTSSMPQAVLRTAVISEGLSFTVALGSDEKIVLFLYFAELQQLRSDETREFNVLEAGLVWYKSFRPSYLKGMTVYTDQTGVETTALFSLNSTSNSTRPPMINAREVYGLKRLEFSPTDSGDSEFLSLIDIFLLFFDFVGWKDDNQESFIRL